MPKVVSTSLSPFTTWTRQPASTEMCLALMSSRILTKDGLRTPPAAAEHGGGDARRRFSPQSSEITRTSPTWRLKTSTGTTRPCAPQVPGSGAISDTPWQMREFCVVSVDGHRIMFGSANTDR